MGAAPKLEREFRDQGIDVRWTVPAWSGARPRFGGYSNHNLLFTRWRALAAVGDHVELWTRWSGLSSRRLIAADDVVMIRPGRKYDRVRIGTRRVWLSADDRSKVWPSGDAAS